jgi:hypothetical protein
MWTFWQREKMLFRNILVYDTYKEGGIKHYPNVSNLELQTCPTFNINLTLV